MNRLWVRLSIAFVFVAVISALAVALLATPAAGSQFRQYVARRDLLSQTGILEDLAAYYQANGSWTGVESVLAQSTGRGQGRGRPPLLLADAAGSIVYDERNVRAGTALSAGERDGALPLEVKGATVGFLSLGAPGRGALAANEQDYLDQLQRTLLIAAVVAAGLGIVVGVAISRTVSRPLAQLARAARAFAAHNWEQRVKAGGAEEVAEVAFAFNDMADALQQAETLRAIDGRCGARTAPLTVAWESARHARRGVSAGARRDRDVVRRDARSTGWSMICAVGGRRAVEIESAADRSGVDHSIDRDELHARRRGAEHSAGREDRSGG
jgi:HAMP domain-containing protein